MGNWFDVFIIQDLDVARFAAKAASELKNTVGVVDHGLFIGMSTAVIIAGSDGVYVKK